MASPGLQPSAGSSTPGRARRKAAASRARGRVEGRVLDRILRMPEPMLRRLAGPPVQLDGLTLDLETQAMLRVRELAREPDLATLPIPRGRRALLRQSKLSGGRHPIGDVVPLQVPGAVGDLDARLYIPRSQASSRFSSTTGGPLLFFAHGGGMIYGDLDSHDALCRFLAEHADMRVLAVDYRLAPEHPFPAPVEDCWAAFCWVADNASRLGASRVAVGGDSAGGALAAVIALQAAAAGVPVAHQLLLYPVTDMAEPTPSRKLFSEGFFLTSAFMRLAEQSYLLPGQDLRDPRVSVAYAPVPSDLAPALVVTAGFDPLRDEGEAYADRLAAAGVPVSKVRYPGFIHGFANVVGAGRSQPAAVAEIADRLRSAL
ncbi:MAG TPA: alpha/beta hydrolase [Nocardioidaceae bacterium]|nr:alpha/beta hydrolase [Nocardioidaceae bacterium]